MLNDILNSIAQHFSQFSYYFDGQYYVDLFYSYYNVLSFCIGFAFFLTLYYSSANIKRKIGFFRAICTVVVINSTMVIVDIINSIFDVERNRDYGVESFNSADNVFGFLIIVLLIRSCYRGYRISALLFGVATFLSLCALQPTEFIGLTAEKITFIILRVFLAGLFCYMISIRKHFYSKWAYAFAFFLFLRLLDLIIPIIVTVYNGGDLNAILNFDYIYTYFASFRVEYTIFTVILVFAIFYEKYAMSVAVPTPKSKLKNPQET